MKLKVQTVDVHGVRHLVVTDENDEMLPNLVSVEVRSHVNDVDKVVVTMILDEENIRLIERK